MSHQLNPMAASFNLSSGAVAAVAAAAAAAVFGGSSQNSSNATSMAHNLLLNLNTQQLTINSQQTSTNNISGLTSTSSLNQNYQTDKIDWINRIETSHIDRTLMNKLVMNYLVTEGFKEAADKFCKETGLLYQYDSDSLDDRMKIRELIEMGKIYDAICSINKLHPELIDSNRQLAFHLQQQQFIELIRDKRLEEALEFAQNHLSEYSEFNEQIQEELERTMALLAFENPDDSPFFDLLQPVQRQRLASEVNSAILEFENLESNAKLQILIKMILWSQDSLDKRNISYPKMIDIANARIDDAALTSTSNLSSFN